MKKSADNQRPAESQASEPQPQSKALGYEVHDISLKIILWIGGIVLIAILIAWITPRWLLDQRQMHQPRQAEPGLLEEIEASQAPLLQTQPQHEYSKFIRRDRERLHSFGWTDRQQGIAHVPIGFAVQQLVSPGGQTHEGTDEHP